MNESINEFGTDKHVYSHNSSGVSTKNADINRRYVPLFNLKITQSIVIVGN
ncbi:hypothetical protein GCM10007162_06450 [Ignatzschineria ureiclastica]|nr:hypothetical protein GCM10007162_06450 [Ignatzschineria ureiclastica]